MNGMNGIKKERKKGTQHKKIKKLEKNRHTTKYKTRKVRTDELKKMRMRMEIFENVI